MWALMRTQRIAEYRWEWQGNIELDAIYKSAQSDIKIITPQNVSHTHLENETKQQIQRKRNENIFLKSKIWNIK